MKRFRLSKIQKNRMSEIFGNISVAWFSAGIIGPVFAPTREILAFVILFGISLVMAVTFIAISLIFIKGR